ncbi:MAG: ATP-binding cassette domain-containing protein [Propionibacteriaceae bacterium]|jgi:D-xylose transport system ATP-binding protein|nr:ATP-binding cassette domain-containing protein [Propionibacteriaceae bacterium]
MPPDVARVAGLPAPVPGPVLTAVPALALRGVSLQFGGVRALEDIDFDINPHEIVALVGENAAGKSSLAKVMAGVYRPTAGTILSEGTAVTIPTPAAAARLGIATVFQDLALANNLDVTANMFLGHELNKGYVLQTQDMDFTARATLNEIGARVPSLRAAVGTLSAGQRQSIAVARALLAKPRIVVLDEPTSSLSVTQTAEMLDLIVRLRKLGHGIVLISHNLADVQAVADRIVVMRLGRIVGESPMSQVSYEDIVAAITGAVRTLPAPRAVRGSRVVGTVG